MFQPTRLLLTMVFTLSAVAPFAQAQVDYARDVKPLIKARCYACHGALKQESGLRLDTGSLIRRGGDSGAAVVSGQADESLLIEKVTTQDESLRMPPEGEPLTKEQIELVKNWIAQGATSPAAEQPEPDPRQHWSFQLPVRPAVADVGFSDRQQNPIDAFVAAELARQGLTARPAAAKHVLLRRVYLDLIGLPPTRAELHEFLADDSPAAYEAVVDRLLNDPRHGERWARHWMDIWRYSDWYGRRYVPDVWNSAPQIWRWRDWIVRSLNADHGYDRMLREMLAADEICPEDDDAAVATGYLIRNWYALNPNDWMRNTVEHTGKAFLGLTFNCAHCHDHKYDPITQVDYFRLRAFFEPISVRQDRVRGEADPGPFQEYSYSTLRKIQRLGAVRIYDKSPDAPTWFYTGGDERNRVTDRGSIPPGVPTFLAASPPEIATVELSPRAWYPGLRPAIHDTVLADARAAIAQAESELQAAQKISIETPAAARDQLVQAEAAFQVAVEEASKSGRPGALVGRQSLLLEATAGRRIVQNGLSSLKALEDGTTLAFELLILNDAHINFQLAKDVVKGLTAGYVAFERGRIVSYQPGSFTEFEAGTYDFAAGQKRFRVTLVVETKADRCLLSVRSVTDDKVLIERVPVALNGWNPVGDSTKAISIDCRTGSIAVVDQVTVTAPLSTAATAGTSPARLVTFDFEPPTYTDGQDIGGIEGWAISPFGAAPATSVVSATALSESLRTAMQQVKTAQRAIEAATLPTRATEAKHKAAQAQLLSLEARIAADRAKHGETPEADAAALARTASHSERAAAVLNAEADVLGNERALMIAEAKPTTDANRAKEIGAANKQLAASRPVLDKARAAANEASEIYTSFSPSYPATSTGRRTALAEWMTDRDNPLTARVAINHIWARHFHSPLVASVTDFGLSGAKPTHPQLLDWLAVELMDNSWNMKHVHRLIVTSAAYRRTTRTHDEAADNASFALEKDPENKLLWRMNSGRMEAEVVRDSLLFVASKLDMTVGGQELENSEALTTFRRSLYYSVYPEQGGKSPLGELFDAPDALDCYRRSRSIVPQQALALTNSELVHQVSSDLAQSLSEGEKSEGARERGGEGEMEDRRFVVACFEVILTRGPSAEELEVCLEVMHGQRNVLAESNVADVPARAQASLVRVLLNHNDFVTIR